MSAMSFEVHSISTLDAIGEGLHKAAAKHGIGILTVHDLRPPCGTKVSTYPAMCASTRYATFIRPKKVLDADPSVSTVLPCRIAVFTGKEANTLSMIRPTAMMKAFQKAEIESVAEKLEQVMKAMMQEAAK